MDDLRHMETRAEVASGTTTNLLWQVSLAAANLCSVKAAY